MELLRKIGFWIGFFGGGLVLAFLCLLIVADVIGRYVFNTPIRGVIDITELGVTFIVFSCLAYAQATTGHIKVEVLEDQLKGKIRLAVKVTTLFLSLLVCIAIFVGSIIRMCESLRIGELRGDLLPIPQSPARIALALGMLLVCITMVVELVYLLRRSKDRKKNGIIVNK